MKCGNVKLKTSKGTEWCWVDTCKSLINMLCHQRGTNLRTMVACAIIKVVQYLHIGALIKKIKERKVNCSCLIGIRNYSRDHVITFFFFFPLAEILSGEVSSKLRTKIRKVSHGQWAFWLNVSFMEDSSVTDQPSMASSRTCGTQISSSLCLFSFTERLKNSH